MSERWTFDTVKTQVGSCHRIGPLSFDFHGKPAYACIYVDGYVWPENLPRTPHGKKSIEDARIMAASKDLLEALKAVLETCAHDEAQECESCRKGYAAIKRAEEG